MDNMSRLLVVHGHWHRLNVMHNRLRLVMVTNRAKRNSSRLVNVMTTRTAAVMHSVKVNGV